MNTVAFREVLTDECYMTTRQLQYFRDKLLRWRSELCRQKPCLDADRDDPGLQPDWIDSASLSTSWHLMQARRDRTVDTLRQIDAALARIAAGTYGFCEESGEEIGLERLLAMPTARLSVEAQSDLERRRRIGR